MCYVRHYLSTILLAIGCMILSAPQPGSATQKTVHIEWAYNPAIHRQATGFRLYHDGRLLCETDNPRATSLDCTLETDRDEASFTMTALLANGQETPHSPPYTLQLAALPLKAIAATDTISGEVPLTVRFDGCKSTGTITSYTWSFGDGSTRQGCSQDYTFEIPGKYNVTLTVIDDSGKQEQVTTVINAEQGKAAAAIAGFAHPEITITPKGGPAPATIHFRGAMPATANTAISSWTWNFGDGSGATGAEASHQYQMAGVYNVQLTVTDTRGNRQTFNSPVVITPGNGKKNQAPSAIITASAKRGPAPMKIHLSAGNSSDKDGKITSFTWYLGDGTIVSGTELDHTFVIPATYTVRLVVTDNQGAQSSAELPVVVDHQGTAPFQIELGGIALAPGTWNHIQLKEPFINPVIIPGPVNEQWLDRVKVADITPNGFALKIEAADNQDEPRTLSYLALEQGVFTLDNGLRIEAGSFLADTKTYTHTFQEAFDTPPVLFVKTVSNGDRGEDGTLVEVTEKGFVYMPPVSENDGMEKIASEITYIAVSQGSAKLGNLLLESMLTNGQAGQAWSTCTFREPHDGQPYLFTAIQSGKTEQKQRVLHKNLTEKSVDLRIDSESVENVPKNKKKISIGLLSISSKQQ